MAIGYRAILRLDKDQDAIALVEEQLGAWLQDKARDRRSTVEVSEWGGAGVHRLGPSAELHVVHDDYAAEQVKRHLYRLIETNSTGRFVVSIFAAALPRLADNNQTVVVEVEKPGVDQETALNTIDPPRIARALLEAVDIRDGHTPLTGRPIVVQAGETPKVVRAITDPGRIASVIVAGSFAPELDNDWAEAVTSLTRQSVGVASTFVVYADAMQELDAALGDSHHVGGGRVRTYLPKVDLTDASDALRHKWLGPATLSRSLTGKVVALPLQRRHAEGARRRFVESELPSDVRRTIGILRRAETTAAREAKVAERMAKVQSAAAGSNEAVDSQPVGASVGEDIATRWYKRAGKSIQRWLGIDNSRPEHLDDLDAFIAAKIADSEVAVEQLDEAAGREDELDTKIKALQRRVEDMELDLAQAEQDDIEGQRELTELRRRLAKTTNPDTYVEPDSVGWAAPDSVEELVGRITSGEGSHQAHQFVEFTGDLNNVLEVDRRYPSGLYARTLWLYVRVLHDYAQAKSRGDFSGSVYMYLTDDRIDGARCAPARHASRESDTVLQNADWSAERVSPVPASVDLAESVLMDAHFKPTHKDTFAPRMHYYDDTAPGGTGRVYVGYIGKHLTNTRT
ncbi:hypothetical protein [Microbacterium sp.]|uniref:hypothetical protein n=1 Tax=Microbacterium sp. TaxID=51671 RepID=UPI003C1867FF